MEAREFLFDQIDFFFLKEDYFSINLVSSPVQSDLNLDSQLNMNELFPSECLIKKVLQDISAINNERGDFSRYKIAWPADQTEEFQSLTRSLFQEILAQNPRYLFNFLLKGCYLSKLPRMLKEFAATIIEYLLSRDPLIIHQLPDVGTLSQQIPKSMVKTLEKNEIDIVGLCQIIHLSLSTTSTISRDANLESHESDGPLETLTLMSSEILISIYFNNLTHPKLIWMKSLNQLSEAGYVFHYFNFMNVDHLLMKSHLGQIELIPSKFEQLCTAKINNYESALTLITQMGPYCDPSKLNNSIVWSRGRRFGGWRKRDLVEAIRKVSLLTYSTGSGLRSGTTNPFQYSRPMICQLRLSNETRSLTGFGKHPYHRREYYEQIYRSLFRTLRSYDWVQITQNKYLPLEVSQFIATYEFHLDQRLVIQTNRKQLKEIFDTLTHIRYLLHSQTLTEMCDIVKLQPESWISYADLPMRSHFSDKTPVARYEFLEHPFVYKELLVRVEGENKGLNIPDKATYRYHLLQILKDLDVNIKDPHLSSLDTSQLTTILNKHIQLIINSRQLTLAPTH